MNNLMTLWGEAFQKLYPNVKIQIEGKGSHDRAAGADRRHVPVRPDVPGHEAHRDRPVRAEVRLQAHPDPDLLRRAGGLREQGQPDREADLRPGGRDLLQDPQARRQGRHHDLGRASASRATGRAGPSASTAATPPAAPTASSRSTRSCNGDYKDTVKEQPGSASVVQGVTEDRFGIGYSGIGYQTSGVKAAHAGREGRRRVLRRQPTRT